MVSPARCRVFNVKFLQHNLAAVGRDRVLLIGGMCTTDHVTFLS